MNRLFYCREHVLVKRESNRVSQTSVIVAQHQDNGFPFSWPDTLADVELFRRVGILCPTAEADLHLTNRETDRFPNARGNIPHRYCSAVSHDC